MARYRKALPQLGDRLFLTDGGIETTLIFNDGIELPDFAAFDLLQTSEGTDALRRYFRTYADLARRFETGLILESATWRANPDWSDRRGYTRDELVAVNRAAIALLAEVRAEHETPATPIVISGCIGPRGDGYVPAHAMTEREAERYHDLQVAAFAGSEADMVCAITMNYVEEAIGIARAALRRRMPVAISFTVETDGKLPTGQALQAAIERVDAETGGYASYYMVNCAHPTHFAHVLAEGGSWVDRIHGVRANASRRSHAELNEAPDLDAGNPRELGQQYRAMRDALPQLNVMGGCCGTDHRHLEQIAESCVPLFSGSVR
jgi:homocysteine S-methyltransferase